MTVKELLLVGLPFTVTVNGPIDAPEGTKVTMLISVQWQPQRRFRLTKLCYYLA